MSAHILDWIKPNDIQQALSTTREALSSNKGATLLSLALVLLALLTHRILSDPLRSFPGPPLARFSNILHSRSLLSGRQPYHVLRLHEKYGPVVRTAPNELSFNTPASWRDIYNHRQGHRPFVKTPNYNGLMFADTAHTLVSEQDVGRHASMRKYLAHAFSDRALKDQEVLVQEIIDEMISQLDAQASGPEGADLSMWYSLCTFDIVGSLAFGESFGGLKNQEFHAWIILITDALRQVALVDTLVRFPALAWLVMKFAPGTMVRLVADKRKNEAMTMDAVQKRLKRETNRPDFFTKVLENRDSKGVSDLQLAAHASDFVAAGSETTSTALSAATFYLLTNPACLEKLQAEIRGAFATYDSITGPATAKLPYLHAVAQEAMRIFAPVPLDLSRIVPAGGDTVDGHHVPGGTVVSAAAVASCLSSANYVRPWDFVPERWLGAAAYKGDKLEASQPFSLGPRVCIGRNLAWMELNVMLAKMIWTFDMDLIETGLDWQARSTASTVWDKPELKVRVKRRDV